MLIPPRLHGIKPDVGRSFFHMVSLALHLFQIGHLGKVGTEPLVCDMVPRA
jgi:hypothetical protein